MRLIPNRILTRTEIIPSLRKRLVLTAFYLYKVKEKNYKDMNDPKLYDFSPGEQLITNIYKSVYSEKSCPQFVP